MRSDRARKRFITVIFIITIIMFPVLKWAPKAAVLPISKELTGVLVNTQNDISSNIHFTVDVSRFLGDKNQYDTKLSIASSVYAYMVYNGVYFQESKTKKAYGILGLLEFQGFLDVQDYVLSSNYSDNHISEVAVGHRKVTYKDKTREVIAIIIRGTDGTIEEWTSNFDVGTLKDYKSSKDWIVKDNHMGFDIASTRILRYVKNYLSTYVDSSIKKVFWITGHSRGAALANIIGARLEDKGNDTYTYTFGAPNTTTSVSAKNYSSIFNIVNTDDLVPCLPMKDWGFVKYGKEASVSVAKHYENEWEDLTGYGDYNPDTVGMTRTVDALASIAKDRDDCYSYTCNCHGDNSNDSITITDHGMSKASREAAIGKIPYNALPYCVISRRDGGIIGGWDFDCCQTPAYFMQLLAAQMAGTINAYQFAVDLNIAKRYEDAKGRIISSAIGGLAHPHYQESYYILANHINETNFK